MLNDTTSKLTSAVSSLPELLEKKRLLDSHTNIATALLDHIKVNLIRQCARHSNENFRFV